MRRVVDPRRTTDPQVGRSITSSVSTRRPVRGGRHPGGAARGSRAERRAAKISYRLGDTRAPALPEREALAAMVTEFAASIREGRPARTDGASALRVLSVLEAGARSVEESGALMPVPDDAPVEVGR